MPLLPPPLTHACIVVELTFSSSVGIREEKSFQEGKKCIFLHLKKNQEIMAALQYKPLPKRKIDKKKKYKPRLIMARIRYFVKIVLPSWVFHFYQIESRYRLNDLTV